MSVPLLETENLSIAFGGVKAVDGVSLKVQPRRIHSIIGPNGAGKTTLFNLISGLYQPSSGRVRLAGEDVTGLPPDALARRGLSRSFQNLQIFFRMSALDNVMVGRHQHEKTSLLSHVFALPSVRRENARSREIAMALLARVGLADVAEKEAGSLSYGALKRLEIARALATEPRILLLDEPAAGCNAIATEEIDRLAAGWMTAEDVADVFLWLLGDTDPDRTDTAVGLWPGHPRRLDNRLPPLFPLGEN